MSQVLAAEVAGFGIRVTAVEPGGFATHYGASVNETAHRIDAYRETVDPMLAAMRQMEDLPEIGRPRPTSPPGPADRRRPSRPPSGSRSARTPTPTSPTSKRPPAPKLTAAAALTTLT
ncbi:hypothetical protein GCM10020229_47420 [Kitasatospora albolonga]|uniref:hypothetical protein n=1 Tax=Kitasatospora albolonga TaxID=68173 RepID=UPI0031F192F6